MEIYKDDNYAWEEHELEDDGFMDYKNPQISHFMRGYPSDTVIRLGVLFFDKTGRPFAVRHLKDVSVGSPGDYKTPKRNEVPTNHFVKVINEYDQTNGQIISLKISNLDISDIKDLIGGFMIVRSPIVHTRIGSAFINPIRVISGNELRIHSRTTLAGIGTRKQKVYAVYSPESLFSLSGFNIESEDKLEINSYLELQFRQIDSITIGIGTSFALGFYNAIFRYAKFYKEANTEASTKPNGQLNAKNKILFTTRVEKPFDDISINPLNPAEFLHNQIAYPVGSDTIGWVGNHLIIITENEETSITGHIGNDDTDLKKTTAVLCDIIRENENPYGGFSESALANNIYVATGHFQIINQEVLGDIEKDNKWIFDEIQIFGGDTFVGIHSLAKTLGIDASNRWTQAIIYPVESRINIALRSGDHIAKNVLLSSIFPDGLRHVTSGENHRWEQYNYNDGYSSDDIGDFYLPLPFNFKNESDRSTRIRWSPEKNYGERRDNFRVFDPFSTADVDVQLGEVNNIRYKFSKLIYWQNNAIGYIPINERAMTANEFGQPIQLGIGGIFERFDEVVDKIGNSNQFSLVESDIGFHWFDSVRRIFVTIDYSLKLSEESVIKGLDNYFSTIRGMHDKDNPVFSFGITGGYDYKNKNVYLTFHCPDGCRTISYNIKADSFTGFCSFLSRMYIPHQGTKTNLYGVKDGDIQQVFLHTDKKQFGEYYGEQHDAYFEMVFPTEGLEPHKFDNLEVIGNEHIPARISYNSYDKTVEEEIARYAAQMSVVNRNWRYRNNRWYGNIPLFERQRLINDYLKVKFIFDSGFTFDQFITMVKLKARRAF